jgi:hypothetical protein
MKKIILSTILITTTIVFFIACSKEIDALNFDVKTIQTEFGKKTITTKVNGNQAILFTKEEFKEILRYVPNLNRNGKTETNYSEGIAKLDFDEIEEPIDIDPKLKEAGIKIKIKIGALKYNCRKGIGFRCGGTVGPYAKIELNSTEPIQPYQTSKVGRNLNRSYDCIIKELNGKFEFEFIETVDWDWLENTEI